jgi:hypothetical protein
MRITDDRYSRDTAKMNLAIRLIRLEARTRTIRRWTGLSDDRIRKLYRSYLRDSKSSVRRHRGKSPQRSNIFLGTGRAARHATALASLLSAIGALPAAAAANKDRNAKPALSGDLVCDAYEAYCSLLPSREIGFEHAILLASALSSGRELRLADCRQCASPVLADAINIRLPACERCEPPREEQPPRHAAVKLDRLSHTPAWSRPTTAPIRSPDPISTGAPKSVSSPTGSSARVPTKAHDS